MARKDPAEEFIKKAVKQIGWAVQLIPEGDAEDEPPFAYTAGLHTSFGHPELICIGLPHEIMHAMLSTCAELVKAGEKLPVGKPFHGVLGDYKVKLVPVKARKSFDDHVGYAIWWNGGRKFPLLQLLWPDKAGKFPGQRGAAAFMKLRQPVLP